MTSRISSRKTEVYAEWQWEGLKPGKWNLELCARATRMLIRRKWGMQWNCGQVTEGIDQMLVLMQLCGIHQALPAAATTHLFH